MDVIKVTAHKTVVNGDITVLPLRGVGSMPWDRVLGMSHERLCRFFVKHALGHVGRWWVEYVYDKIDRHEVKVPERLREQVASIMLKLKLDGFGNRDYVWILVDMNGVKYRGKLKVTP